MARALLWVVLGTLSFDLVVLAIVSLVFSITYDDATTIGLSLLVLWSLWLAILVTTLITAVRQHATRWLITFVVLGVFGVANTLLVAFKATTAPVFELYFNLLQPFMSDPVSRTIIGDLLILVICLLPLPVAALWYRPRRALDDAHR